MAIDRSKFKSSVTSAVKQQDKEVESIVKNRGENAEFLKIKDGNNKFRIFPYHPDGGGSVYAEAKVIHWLPGESAERDDKGNIVKDDKGNPKIRKTNKPIFNSKVHGDTSKDIIEEYISFAEKVSKEIYAKEDDRKAFLEPIIGNFNKKINGILAKSSWVIYANKIEGTTTTFGKLEIGKAVKFRLNAISATESSDEPLGTDPFTDINDGRAIIITYDKDAKKATDYYSTEIDSSFDKVTKQINLYPLTDEDLEKFEKFPSLASMFKKSYKRKDFDLALKGLKMFDDEHELGIFAYEGFLDIADEISGYYEESEETSEKVEAPKGDVYDQMNRDELKVFIRDNETGMIVRPNITDDMLRDHLREWEASESEVVKEVAEEKEVDEELTTPEAGDLPWEKEEDEAPKVSSAAKEKMAAMRAKMSKK